MILYTYEVIFSVDGKKDHSILVEAENQQMAKRVALGKIDGMPGYVGRIIKIEGVSYVGPSASNDTSNVKAIHEALNLWRD